MIEDAQGSQPYKVQNNMINKEINNYKSKVETEGSVKRIKTFTEDNLIKLAASTANEADLKVAY